MKYILSLDQGTTSSRAVIFDSKGNTVAISKKEFTQYFPNPAWVEHDALEILETQLTVAKEAISKANLTAKDIACIGITNQRETTVVWDAETGKSVYNAIVWQCRRTAPMCDEIKKSVSDSAIRAKTGLNIDAYFSASKIKWILDNVDGARERAEKGELLFGTVDSWLVWNLTGGRVHATDCTNASRTLLYNINTLEWDNELLSIFGIPRSMLPEVLPSGGEFGNSKADIFGSEIPICSVIGDQQASLFGQCCFGKGEAKNTYGTGCFVLMNTGSERKSTPDGTLISTVGWKIGNEITYASEGSVFMGGALIKWLSDDLKIISSPAEAQSVAESVPDSKGVVIVPAFTGLGAPYWEPYARGSILGLTRGVTSAHIVRSALEAIAYQSADVIFAMEKETSTNLLALGADGGASANSLLMQIQSDIIGKEISVPVIKESTAFGAAALAGLVCGVFDSFDEIRNIRKTESVFKPRTNEAERKKSLDLWHKAVRTTIAHI